MDYSKYQHALFDGTYFHKQGCLAAMMAALTPQLIDYAYVSNESYPSIYPLLLKLREQGLNLKAVTMDGHRLVALAFKHAWPEIKIQRCLYHILRQGFSWIRMRPKTEAAQALRRLLFGVCQIHSFKERDKFLDDYYRWRSTYSEFIKSLPKTSVAFKDLKRTAALIENAIPDMFHYLDDPSIQPTTNKLESFFSRLKTDFQKHRGLSESHKKAYLKWYCYYQNQ